jgi:hypothetical protein
VVPIEVSEHAVPVDEDLRQGFAAAVIRNPAVARGVPNCQG